VKDYGKLQWRAATELNNVFEGSEPGIFNTLTLCPPASHSIGLLNRAKEQLEVSPQPGSILTLMRKWAF